MQAEIIGEVCYFATMTFSITLIPISYTKFLSINSSLQPQKDAVAGGREPEDCYKPDGKNIMHFNHILYKNTPS